MKVTLLGHASVLVEMNGARALMDPVFQDPFEDTAVVSCPRRTIDLDALPPVDLLAISHAHLDHFDIPSLARVAKTSRECDVLCPRDKTIVYALERLGFTNIHPEAAGSHFRFPKFELLTTRSNVSNVIELGVVFKDPTGTFWNQVDTVVSPPDAMTTAAQAGRIDLLFAMYASQNFDFFESRGVGFPHAMHQLNLSTVMAIRPRLVVPGSAGFRFAGKGMDWCNAFLFPMSRERFLADLRRVAPEIDSRIANPGDMFEIARGAVHHRPAASPIAKTVEDDTARLRFDPTAAVPALEDPNPSDFSEEHLRRAVADCLDGFAAFIRGACGGGDEVVDEYRTLGVTYAVGIVFPAGREQWLRVTLDASGARFDEQEGAGTADIGHRIVASALTAWIAREKSYFYLRAFSRKWSNVYALAAADGKASVEPKEPPDLLAYYLQRKAKGADMALKAWLDFQLAPFVRARN